MDIGIEIKTKDKIFYATFSDQSERDSIYKALKKLVPDTCTTTDKEITFYTEIWVNGGMSNKDYLFKLNSYA